MTKMMACVMRTGRRLLAARAGTAVRLSKFNYGFVYTCCAGGAAIAAKLARLLDFEGALLCSWTFPG